MGKLFQGDFFAVKAALVVVATIGLYSVLWKENKFYRFWEHVFLGLAGGWAIVALWVETLKPNWWDNMAGLAAEGTDAGKPGYWAWMFLLPIGLCGYAVFTKKHAWMSRVPVGVILGIWSVQQLQNFWNTYGPQIEDSVSSIWPTTTSSFAVPSKIGLSQAEMQLIDSTIYPSQAITNLIALITVLSVLSYFIFSIDFKSKFLMGSSKLGRYLLMVGFGAIFGNTVMMRFSLLIDRMYYICIEVLKQGVGGGQWPT